MPPPIHLSFNFLTGQTDPIPSLGFLLCYFPRGLGLRVVSMTGDGVGVGQRKGTPPPSWGSVSGQQHTVSFPPPVEINS